MVEDHQICQGDTAYVVYLAVCVCMAHLEGAGNTMQYFIDQLTEHVFNYVN